MMNLFVCMTPLQSLIAEKIISHESLNKADCQLIYLVLTDNEKNHYYYSRLAEGMAYAEYIDTGRSVTTVNRLRTLFKNKKYNVYVASIDDTLIHYVLSFVKLHKLTTFDDGLANIFPNSSYYLGVDRGRVRGCVLKIANYLLGNRFSLDSIKRKTKKHYTIYPDFRNVVEKIESLNLLNLRENELVEGGSINIFLGTMYEEVTYNATDANSLWGKVNDYIESSDGDWLYIPHPRDKRKNVFNNLESSLLIAEEQIIVLRKKHKEINLYGFASSTQFNLMGVPDINIYPVNSVLLSDKAKEAIKLLSFSCNIEISLERNDEN